MPPVPSRAALVALSASLAAAGLAPSLRADDDRDDDRDEDRAARTVRPSRDLRVDIAVSPGATAGGTATVDVIVRNVGRRTERDVQVVVCAGDLSSEPLFTSATSVPPKQTRTVRAKVAVPAGATALAAGAWLPGDGMPGSNYVRVSLSGSRLAYPAAGGATWAAQCASCHGAQGEGSSKGPRVRGEDADEIAEVVRKGEDGMPRFVGIDAAGARDLAAWLADPSVPPVTPPGPDPGDIAPTWDGGVRDLFAAHCASCHGGARPSARVGLDTKSRARKDAQSALSAIEAGSMPPAGPLPAETVAVFEAWVAGGRK
ncbi:MAG: hypothetical protein HMLKMBBP_02177 [Planctomycetes bacterium]|nr:hypothetical protein [Planctomycetota bacterium]